MNKNINAMKTTFEQLSEQEMINVTGGDILIKITDRNGRVIYVLIEDGRP
ncbi:MAG: bacteriocin [Bacteroidales bacterium]|nr:bacteriocin [Bacteroidales bacterium]MDD2425047.1 bacteriocin [Bacteroidales bacterium]MDD3988644.1 bacteriocin [Bacteroidales bacterium]MDD4638326.1 bacteriocin [Bacteroidales bacterium]